MDTSSASFEGFMALARAAVEQEARENADNRWWVLAPTLLVVASDGTLHPQEISPRLAERPLGRALAGGDVVGTLDALGARRCALALHADLEVDGEIFAAIVLAVLGKMTRAFVYAPVTRTDLGTPELAEWRSGALGEAEVFAAVRRAILPEG